MKPDDTVPHVPLNAQIKEVGREIGNRAGAYPKFVAKGRYTQAEADQHQAEMRAVYRTLKWIEEHDAFLRACVANKQAILTYLALRPRDSAEPERSVQEEPTP